ncbi:MAG TPA: LON peptidase substrate-binding domain-containing protein, partial [Bacteroidales bacterium]|nr:LON peptidase substrate-binding domain-containing protein [Bacteroidales bacterium]
MEFSAELEKKLKLLSLVDNETEFIPLFTNEEEEQMNSEELPETLPILPLRNTVLFPGVVIPITVGRDKSIRLIKEAYKAKKNIGVVSQIDPNVEEPTFNDLYKVGTVAIILKTLHMPDGSTTIIIQGKKRFTVLDIISTEPYFTASIGEFAQGEPARNDKKFQALISSLKDFSIQIAKQSPNIPSEAAFAIKNIESPSFLINFVSSNLNIEISEKQLLLETVNITERANIAMNHMVKELQMIELKNQIQSKVKTDLDKQQRDFLLQQQIKQIQQELGDNPQEQLIGELKEKASGKKWSDEMAELFARELGKFQRMNPHAAEYSVQTNYLETIVDLPWNEYTKDNFDLKNAQRILDEDHFGLEKV